MRPIIEITIFQKNKYHLQTDTPRMMKMPKAAKPKYTKLPECTKQLSIHNLVLLLMEKEIREQDKEKEKEFNLLRVSEHLRLLEVRWDSICCVFLNIWDSLRLIETRFTVYFWTFETPWDSLEAHKNWWWWCVLRLWTWLAVQGCYNIKHANNLNVSSEILPKGGTTSPNSTNSSHLLIFISKIEF